MVLPQYCATYRRAGSGGDLVVRRCRGKICHPGHDRPALPRRLPAHPAPTARHPRVSPSGVPAASRVRPSGSANAAVRRPCRRAVRADLRIASKPNSVEAQYNAARAPLRPDRAVVTAGRSFGSPGRFSWPP
ncbi:hypothetical protein, partial [Streptomyces decoyicus]